MSRIYTSKGRSDPWRTYYPRRPVNLPKETRSIAWSLFSTAVWIAGTIYAAKLWMGM
jgi:hypothetical protein